MLSSVFLAAAGFTARATTLDTIVFGDAASEQAHGLVAPLSQTATGGLGQPVRQLLVDPTASRDRNVAGSNWYAEGGYLDFTAKCDPLADNYATIKLWGSEWPNFLIFYVIEDGKYYQVGYRDQQSGNYAASSIPGGESVPAPNSFIYQTVPLPLSLTQGRTSVHLRLVGYILPDNAPSQGIYRAYVHTGAYLVPDAADPQAPPRPPAPLRPLDISPAAALEAAMKGGLEDVTSNLQTGGDIPALVAAYNEAWTPAYHNPAVGPLVAAKIDALCRNYFADPASASGGWGGSFGYIGDWIHGVGAAGFGSLLDQVVDLGDPAGAATRRVLWGKMLKASADAGRFGRLGPTTAQSLIGEKSFYGANKGLLTLGSPDAIAEEPAKRYIFEAMGLLPWLGSDNPAGGSYSFMGKNYFLVTPSGLQKEDGYVSSYGEAYDLAAAYYEQSDYDPRVGDRAAQMIRARSYFRYPMPDGDGYRSFQMVGPLDWRHQQEINVKWAYGEAGGRLGATTATKDPHALGFARQMFNDNRGIPNGADFYTASTLRTILNTPDPGYRLPMTEGQPDFAWCDVDNGVVAIKVGEELTWIEPYWQARTGLNGSGRTMQVTPNSLRIGHVRTDVQFKWNQQFTFTNDYTGWDGLLNMPYGTVHGAYAYEKIEKAAAPPDADQNREEFVGRAAFYACRYGRYLVGINMSKADSYVLKTPPGFTSAVDLISRETLSGTITVAPASAVVLDLVTNEETAALPGTPRYIAATGLPAGISVTWDTAGGASSYLVQRATSASGPFTTIASNIGASYPRQWGVWPSGNFTDTTAVLGTTYYYTVAGVNAAGQGYRSPLTKGTQISNPASVNTLPAPWKNANLLSNGSASYNSTTQVFTVNGAGGDLWNKADGGNFVYQPVYGDGTILARLTSMGSASIAGLMLRDSLDPAAAQSTLAVIPSGVTTISRYGTGANTYSEGSRNLTPNAPIWLKITRQGTSTIMSSAPDVSGAPGTWTVAYTATNLSVGPNAFVGVYGNSGAPTFDKITLTGFTSALGIPTGFTASAGNAKVSLAWLPADNASSYNLKRATSPGGTYTTLATGLTSLAYTDATALNGTAYNYVVTATHPSGTSADSAVVSASPGAIAAAPTGLTVATSGTQAVLNWTAAAGATSYNILRSTDGVSWTTVASGITDTTFTNTGLTAGQGYYYAVTTSNAAGTSSAGGPVATVAAPLVPVLRTLDSANAQATIRWNATGGAATYNIYRAAALAGPFTQVGANIATTSFVNTGLTPGSDYFYTVTAVNSAGESAPSTPMKLGWGTGLLGKYYGTNSTSGPPILTRIDPVITFNWGEGAPISAMPNDYFSVQWTGQLEAPTTDTYTFYGGADDYVNIDLNGTRVVTNKGSGTINLTAGQKYDITITFGDNSGAAYFSTAWSAPSVAYQTIPKNRLYPAAPGLTARNSGGTASASSEYSGEIAANAFDGSNSTKWFNNTNGATAWLRYQFAAGAKWAITQYNLVSANDNAGRDPAAWQFQGSNDGTTWLTLDTQTAQTFASRYLLKTYLVNNSTPYAFYRLNVTANKGGSGGVQLAEFQLCSTDVLFPGSNTLTAAAGAGQIALSWTPVSTATSYTLKRAIATGGPYQTIATGLTAATYNDGEVVGGITYYYVVTANSGQTEGMESAEATATANPAALAISVPQDLFVEAANAAGAPVSFLTSARDRDGVGFPTTSTPASGSTFPLGTTNVTTTATNASGQSASRTFSVNVRDTTAPVLTAPAAITTLATSAAGAVVTFATSAVDSVSGSLPVTVSPASGSTFPPGTTAVTVSATDAAGNGISQTFNVTVLAVPSPWQTADLGAVAATGSAFYNGGTFTINGSGADIAGTADEFRYVYQNVSGNCQIVARVASLQNTDTLAKAGLIIRETTAANSRYAGIFVTPGSGVRFLRRTNTGGSTATTTTNGVAAPRWLKIVRSTNSFTAFYSADGTTWTQVGNAQTVTMATSVTLGLAVTSKVDGTLATATVDNVTLNTPPTLTVPASITTPATSPSGAIVNFTTSAADSAGNALPTTNSPASGSLFPVGTTTVTAAATDSLGNTVSKTFTVTVQLAIPPTPSGLSATAGYAQIVLGWNPASGATSYQIRRSLTSGSGYATVATIASAANPGAIDTGLTNGTTYYYIVTALNSSGQSPASAPVSATPTSAVDTVSPTMNLANGSAQLHLATSISGRTYQLQRSYTLASDSWQNLGAQPGGSALDFTDTPNPGQPSVFYRVLIGP